MLSKGRTFESTKSMIIVDIAGFGTVTVWVCISTRTSIGGGYSSKIFKISHNICKKSHFKLFFLIIIAVVMD